MEFNLITALLALLIIAGIVVLIAVVRSLKHINALTDSLTQTSQETNKTITDLRDAIVPIINKAEVTVDALNAEMVRIDTIITSIEETSQRVMDTSDKVTEIVNSPLEVVSSVTDRVRALWQERRATYEAKKLEERVSSDRAREEAAAAQGVAPSATAAPEQPSEESAQPPAKAKKKTAYYRVKE